MTVRTPPGPWKPTGDLEVDWLMQRAERSQRLGDLDSALAHLARIVDLSACELVRGAAHFAIGEIFRDREEHSRAAAHLRAASELLPHRADVLYQLGLAQAQQENNKAAADTLRRALDLAPNDAEILRTLGVALASTGSDDEADRLLRRAQAVAPDDVRVLESIATHHLKLGRFQDCGEIVEKATAIAPENALLKRLSKEASYLVELAANNELQGPRRDERRRLRVALEGAAGEVERRFVRMLTERGFGESQVLNARDLWRDYLELKESRVRQVAEHAAAIEYLIGRLDFAHGSARSTIARRHGVSESALTRVYEDIVRVLEVKVFDPRYSTQPHPLERVHAEAGRSGLPPEEVFRALVEDEYRDYEEAHDRSGSLVPRLDRDEFEDASVEYGSLLTRELMGLTLARRDRMRKRELERLLFVT